MTVPQNDISTQTVDRVGDQLVSGGRVELQRLPILEAIFERFAVALEPALRPYGAGLTVEAELLPIDYVLTEQAMEAMPEHGMTLACRAQPWNQTVSMVIEPNLLFSVLEFMLGNRDFDSANWTPRPYSTIEKRLGRRLGKTILETLAKSFSRVSEVDFTIDSIDDTPRTMDLAPSNEPCVKAKVHIAIENQKGAFFLLLPQSSFETVRSVLAEPYKGGQLGGDSSWRNMIHENLQNTHVSLDALLHQPMLRLSDILSWKPGSVIDLGPAANEEAVVLFGDLPLFTADIGRRRNGKLALRVNKDFSEMEEPNDANFD
jgi:flagellar motor switch protein FliM